MDWIRRNWPDLLIGIALVAVIAGIIATLLTGGSFFPLGASQASGSRSEQSSSSFDRGTPEPVADSRADASETAARDQPSVRNEPDDAGNEGPVSVSALPLPGASADDRESESSVAGVGASGNDVSLSNSGVTAAADSGPDANVGPPASDEGGEYRISVGAFSAAENAERQAESFRSAGYPVFIGTQGDLSIVLVGPYDGLAEAERVADRIRDGGFRIEPVIYRFRADSEENAEGNAASDTASSSASRAPAAPEPQPTAARATAGRFLQVGAYATAESAQPQRRRLEGLGFRVTERTEGDLVKLLVGPFDGEEFSNARSLLNEQGIDHFPR